MSLTADAIRERFPTNGCTDLAFAVDHTDHRTGAAAITNGNFQFSIRAP